MAATAPKPEPEPGRSPITEEWFSVKPPVVAPGQLTVDDYLATELLEELREERLP